MQGWSSGSWWWLSARPGRRLATPFPPSTGTTHCRLQEDTHTKNDTQVTAEKMQSVTQSAVHNDRIGDIWPRPVWMCSFPDATQLLALTRRLFKASDREWGALPAPCFSSSAAELVTDCEVDSSASSRGSEGKNKGIF